MNQEILKNLESIELKVKAIKELDNYWNLDIVNLKLYGKMLKLSVKELNNNIEKYY